MNLRQINASESVYHSTLSAVRCETRIIANMGEELGTTHDLDDWDEQPDEDGATVRAMGVSAHS